MQLGTADVLVRAKTGQYKKDLKSAENRTETFGKKAVASIGKVSAGFLALAGVGVAAFSAASIKMLGFGSDLQETQGKFEVVFRGMTESAEAWAETLQDSYAMGETESKKYLSSIQDLLVPTGLARKEAGQLSNAFVKMAADLGSFNNLETADVVRDIQSALQGSSETMAKYGINVKASKVEQEVFRMGLASTKKEVTDAHKAQAIYNIIMREGSDAVGDMARTADSYANQLKRATANVTDLKTEIGENLLPIASDMISDFNDWYKINKQIINQDIKTWANDGANAVKRLNGQIIAIKATYDSVPSSLTGPAGMGLIGAMMFGSSVGKIILAVGLINEGLGSMNMGLGSLVEKHYAAGNAIIKLWDSVKDALGPSAGTGSIQSIIAGLDTVASHSGTISLPFAPPPDPPPSGGGSVDDSGNIAAETKAQMWKTAYEKRYADFSRMNASIVEGERVASEYTMALAQREVAAMKTFNEAKAADFKTAHERMYAATQEMSDLSSLVIYQYKELIEINRSFNEQYAVLGKSRFDLEREQIERMAELYEKAGIEKARIDKLTSSKSIKIAKAEQLAKLDIYQNIAGGIADTFVQISQAGGKQSEEAFMVYKAFAVVEAAIAGHKAYMLALGDPSVPPTPARIALAGVTAGLAAVQIGMIAASQPPSYDSGGISNARGIYQTGDIAEAHIPIPSGGKIPVKVEEKEKQEQRPVEVTIMNVVDPVMMDEYMASARGQDAIVNAVGNRQESIKRFLR